MSGSSMIQLLSDGEMQSASLGLREYGHIVNPQGCSVKFLDS